MEIILATTCTSLTGALNKKHGYYIQKHGKRFFGQRNAKGHVPPDGHLRFILDCADLAQCHLFVSDILVQPSELSEALSEAGFANDNANANANAVLHAADILTLKNKLKR